MENFNATTQNAFSASNQAHLEDHKNAFELNSNEWAGFHQWKQNGRKVSKGAKGCKIFMVCEKKVKGLKGEEKKKVVKALYVFNLQHTETI